MMRIHFAVTGCCVLPAGCGSGAAAVRESAHADEKPRVLSVRYGKVRPGGASSAYYALTVKAIDPDGQIISWAYRELVETGRSVRAVADGGCRLGGRRNGHSYDTPIPLAKLDAGDYRFRVTVEDSTCAPDGRSESASRVVTIHVR